jgi:sigma-B regulation protein RsbU (phosphoserine phosphatase)
MYALDMAQPWAEAPACLSCQHIWGGIKNQDIEVSAGRICASLYSISSHGGMGGDIYYLGACQDDSITRLAIADVTGHGEAVSNVSRHVYQALRSHICGTDSRMILGEVNQRIVGHGLDAMTTAAIVAYHQQAGEARISYAGHPPALYRRADDALWSYARPEEPGLGGSGSPLNLPLAIDADTRYLEFSIPLEPGDQLFIYTDGIIEAPGPDGEPFGLNRLKDVLDSQAGGTIGQIKLAVLEALKRYSGNGLAHDDLTLIAMEICQAHF